MGNISELLYEGIRQKALFFEIIHEYALEGYIFWKKGAAQDEYILLDSKLGNKISCKHSLEVSLDQIPKHHKNFLLRIIKEIEAELKSNSNSNTIQNYSLKDAKVKAKLKYSTYTLPERNEEYILVAVYQTNYFSTSPDSVDKNDWIELATIKNTLDQTEDCVFLFDKDSLQFTYVNQGAIKMMGYSQSELLALHPYDIKPEFPEKKFREMVEPLLAGKIISHRFKTIHKTKSG
jgi:hypothetical protein